MKTLSEVLALCQKTPSWDGITISRLDQKNHLGDTVLHTVCSWGDVDAAKAVIDGGADVNALGDNGATPLFNAVIGESADVVRLLLRCGAKPGAKNNHGTTVLQYAQNTRAPADVMSLLRGERK